MRRLGRVLQEVYQAERVDYAACPTGWLTRVQGQTLIKNSPRQLFTQFTILIVQELLSELVGQVNNLVNGQQLLFYDSLFSRFSATLGAFFPFSFFHLQTSLLAHRP